MSRHLPHALLHQIHWSGIRWYLSAILDIQQSRLREIDSVAQVMLNTVNIQCYKNGRYNNTQLLNMFIYCYSLAVTHCHVLSNSKPSNLTLWLIIHSLIACDTR